MLKYSEIQTAFLDKGIQAEEFNIEDDSEINTPFVVYTATDGDSFGADCSNYVKFLNVELALIDEWPNKTMMRKIELVLDSSGTRFSKNINFDDNERLFSIDYAFQVIDDMNDEEQH